MSLARGLDYYTGVIYEAVLLDPTVGVGSIAAGGRYDNLVGSFSGAYAVCTRAASVAALLRCTYHRVRAYTQSNAGSVVPCVGVSIGVERVFAIMEAREAKAGSASRRAPAAVLVASIPSRRRDMACERLTACAELWRAGISAETSAAPGDPKLAKQVATAAESGHPVLVVLAEDELDRGEVQVKDMAARTATTVPRTQLVMTVQQLLAAARNPASEGPASDAAAAVPGENDATVAPPE